MSIQSHKRVPYVDIAAQHAPIKDELITAISAVIDSGQFIHGEQVGTFEHQFSELCEVPYSVAVNSGTDAMILALRALSVGPGDEVITVPNSFVASTSCIALVGARPVFVDVGPDLNMDVSLLEAAITPRTKAILPVHLTGRPSEMDPITEIADRHNLYVIEDCAQAVTAEYKGKKVGSIGTIGCFSLHPLKTLNACGDGGILTVNDQYLYDRLITLRNHGLKTRDDCEVWGINSRLDTLQAAILLVKLKYLGEWTTKRKANALFYQETLDSVPRLTLPNDLPHGKSVYHTFVVQAEQRNELKQFLANDGVETAIHYPKPIHLQESAASLGYSDGDFPVAESQAKHILSLPIHSDLEQDDLNLVANSIKAFYSG